MNAKSEFLDHTSDKYVLCACIKYGRSYNDDQKVFILRCDYSDSELSSFLSLLNFKYDEGYGGQELYGHIWYKNGTWSERDEYDGSEWWNYCSVPEIPKECAADIKETVQN